MPRSRRRGRAPPSLADFDPNIGIAERDPDNPSVFVYFVCVKSVHDPSFEEARWNHYLDTGRASLPQSGALAHSTSPANESQGPSQDQVQASSASSPVDSRCSGSNRDTPSAAVTAAGGESVTSNSSTCSLCAARLASIERQKLEGNDGSQGEGAHCDDETEGYGRTAGTELPDVPRRRRRVVDNERGGGSRSRSSKTDHRLRRLEKTVESLSHGLIVALTQLKAGGEYTGQGRRGSSPDPFPPAPAPRQSHSNAFSDEIEYASGDDNVDVNDYRNLSTAFAGMWPSENASGGIGTVTSSLQQNNTESSSSLEKNPLQSLRGSQLPSTVTTTTTTTSVTTKAGPENAFSCIATGSDGSLFTTGKEWSFSRMFRPILEFITSSEVPQFLKQAEVHAGLSNSTTIQLFDLFWVLDNLFNVHGGILIYFLRKGLNTMDGISRSLGPVRSNEWSYDLEFLRKLDEAYLKELHPHIHTDGDYNAAARLAWKSYCLNLSQIFFERFTCWQTVVHFRDLSERYAGCFDPVVTTSYVDDLVTLWTPVHPALLEVTRWLEPFIDYGPDYNRATPLYDATIALKCRARELLTLRGAKEPAASWRADSVSRILVPLLLLTHWHLMTRHEPWYIQLLQLLRENRSGDLAKMQLEMERVMKDVSRDFDTTDASNSESNAHPPPGSGGASGSGSGLSSAAEEDAVVVERAKQATGCWLTTTATSPDQTGGGGDGGGGGSSVWLRHALAVHEVRVMKSYRPRLFREGVAAARIRREVHRTLFPSTDGEKVRAGDMKDIFWDQIILL